MRKAWTSLSRFLSYRELSEDRSNLCPRGTRLPAHISRAARTQSRAEARVRRTYVGYVSTYGGFGDTWRSHLNFPGEKYVSPAISPSLSHFPGNPPRRLRRSFSLFRLSRFSSLALAAPSAPTVRRPNSLSRFANVRALIWPTCMYIPHSAVILARSPHSLVQSPYGVIKIAVRGDGANGFRDITPAKLYTRNNT